MRFVADLRPKGATSFWGLDQAFPAFRYGSDTIDRIPVCMSHKPWPTKTREAYIPGTSTLWRPPTSYSRVVARNHVLRNLIGANSAGVRMNEPIYLDYAIAGLPGNYWWNWNTIGMSANTRARLNTEVLLNLKDQKVNVMENLATAIQTASMIGKRASDLFKFLSAVKARDWKRIRRELGWTPRPTRNPSKDMADKWLEYIYGWKPLIQDIYGGWELLNEQLKPAMLFHAKRTLKETVVPPSSGGNSYGNYSYSGKCDIDHKIKIWARLDDKYARDCARAGLTNPVSIAWEVVPFSFLVDWALPIGNVLSALDATHGLLFVGGYVSTRASSSVHVSATKGQAWNVTQVIDPGLSHMEKSSFTREALSGWPVPRPYFKSPFSTIHVANALALYVSMTQKKRI